MGNRQQLLTDCRLVRSPPPAANPTAPETMPPSDLQTKSETEMREHASTYILSMMSHDMECYNDRSGPSPLAVLPLSPRKVNSILAETRTVSTPYYIPLMSCSGSKYILRIHHRFPGSHRYPSVYGPSFQNVC